MSLEFRLEFLASESISIQMIFNAVRLHEITEGEREYRRKNSNNEVLQCSDVKMMIRNP